MLRPIADSADIAHEAAHSGTLMMRHEISQRGVEIKSRSDRDNGNYDAEQPIKNSALLHK